MRKLGTALKYTQIIFIAIELFEDFKDRNYNALLD